MLLFGMGLLWLGLIELTVQWDGIRRIGPVSHITMQDFARARNGGLGVWLQVVEGLHRRGYLILFMELLCIAGRRLFGCGGIGFGRISLFILQSGSGPDLVPLAPFLQCDALVTPVGSGGSG